jgi:hypothetical protein
MPSFSTLQFPWIGKRQGGVEAGLPDTQHSEVISIWTRISGGRRLKSMPKFGMPMKPDLSRKFQPDFVHPASNSTLSLPERQSMKIIRGKNFRILEARSALFPTGS